MGQRIPKSLALEIKIKSQVINFRENVKYLFVIYIIQFDVIDLKRKSYKSLQYYFFNEN